MGNRVGSSIATFLFSIPVSAILLMAIFGIPRLSPGHGESDKESRWQDPRQFFAGLTGNHSSADDFFSEYQASGSRSARDPFASQERNPASSSQQDGWDAPAWHSEHDHSHGHEGPSHHHAQPVDAVAWNGTGSSMAGPAGNRSFSGAQGTSGLPAVTPSSVSQDRNPTRVDQEKPGLTWAIARQRLAELGIRDFHLEPGRDVNSYVFICLFSPGADSQVTHRFEAEADTPLEAVADVLDQIQGWLQRRYAAQTQRVVLPDSVH